MHSHHQPLSTVPVPSILLASAACAMTDMSEQPTKTDGAAVKKASKSLLKLIKDFRCVSTPIAP